MSQINIPGIAIRQLDLSQTAQLLSRSTHGILGVAKKGPLHTPTRITTEEELIATFGTPPDQTKAKNERQRITVSAGATGNFTLKFSNSAATATIAVNAAASAVQSALVALTTVGSGNLTVTGADGGPYLVEFIGTLAERDVPLIEVSAQPSAGTVSVAIVEEGITPPSDFGMQAAVEYLKVGNSLVFVRTCENRGGVWQATKSRTFLETRTGAPRWKNTSGSEKAITIQALTEGEHGNALRARFKKLSGSQNARHSLIFATGVNAQTYTLTVAGGTTGNIQYNTDAAVHAANIKTAIEAMVGVGTNSVTVTGGGVTGNPFIIEYVGRTVGLRPQALPVVTAGTYSGSVTIASSRAGVTPERDVYELTMYGPIDQAGTIGPVGPTYTRLMLVDNEEILAQNDAFAMARVVNDGVRGMPFPSQDIRILPASLPTVIEDINWSLVSGPPGSEQEYSLEGGFSAMDASASGVPGDFSAAYVGTQADPVYESTGLQQFLTRGAAGVTILSVPGVVDSVVLTELARVADVRQDLLALVDTPTNLTPNQAIDWHNKVGAYSSDGVKINSRYCAAYYGWVKIFDRYNRVVIDCPPTVAAHSVIAQSDAIGVPWSAPAGVLRGLVKNAVSLQRTSPSDGAIANMYTGSNVLNPIVDRAVDGLTIWGQRTMQRRQSVLTRINVVRMFTTLARSIKAAGDVLVHEANDEILWTRAINLIRPLCEQIQQQRGIDQFEIQCDSKTNTAALINDRKMRIIVFVIPTQTAETITCDLVAGASGSTFNLSEIV